MLDMLQVVLDNIIVGPVEKQQETATPGLDKPRQPLQNIPDPRSQHAANLPRQVGRQGPLSHGRTSATAASQCCRRAQMSLAQRRHGHRSQHQLRYQGTVPLLEAACCSCTDALCCMINFSKSLQRQ